MIHRMANVRFDYRALVEVFELCGNAIYLLF